MVPETWDEEGHADTEAPEEVAEELVDLFLGVAKGCEDALLLGALVDADAATGEFATVGSKVVGLGDHGSGVGF